MLQPGEGASRERNIILAGFMGCGKSTVGRELARLLHRQLVDIDQQIVQQQRMDVATIFARYGEARFRELEKDLALDLAMRKNLVIATGGGTLLDDRVFAELRVFGFIVYLAWPLEVLLARILETGRYRPLAARYGREGLRALFADREARYREADLEVHAYGFTPDFIAKVIRHAYTC